MPAHGAPLAEDAWAYAVIQVMKPGKRDDPAHFDGAASLLHAGLTVWGRRGLEIRPLPTDQWQNFPQEPGSFYVGNLCAGWHKVAHLPGRGAVVPRNPGGYKRRRARDRDAA